jgi:hypothetical protein
VGRTAIALLVAACTAAAVHAQAPSVDVVVIDACNGRSKIDNRPTHLRPADLPTCRQRFSLLRATSVALATDLQPVHFCHVDEAFAAI